MNFPKFSISNAKIIIVKLFFLWKTVFWKQFSVFILDDLFFAVLRQNKVKGLPSSQKSSSKSKIELRKGTSAEDSASAKFQNVKETEL